MLMITQTTCLRCANVGWWFNFVHLLLVGVGKTTLAQSWPNVAVSRYEQYFLLIYFFFQNDLYLTNQWLNMTFLNFKYFHSERRFYVGPTLVQCWPYYIQNNLVFLYRNSFLEAICTKEYVKFQFLNQNHDYIIYIFLHLSYPEPTMNKHWTNVETTLITHVKTNFI